MAGVVLDGYEIKADAGQHKWAIWFNANGVIYEQVLQSHAYIGGTVLCKYCNFLCIQSFINKCSSNPVSYADM